VTYQDLWCNDKVPFSFSVYNGGPTTVTNIQISVTGGYQDFTATAPSIQVGYSQPVQGNIYAHDTCGKDDIYRIQVSATPSSGQGTAQTYTIDI